MLTKLLKYEFKATAIIFLPLYALVIGLTIVCKLFDLLTKVSSFMVLPSALFTFIYIMSLIAMFVVAFISMIMRFYKNLIGDEGYLSFTLPVKPHKHILSKLIVSIVWLIATCITFVISLGITFFEHGFFEAICSTLAQLSEMMNVTIVGLIVELVIMVLVSLCTSILLFYASMAIGQLLTGHKIVGSVLAYFGFQVATQILVSIGMVILGLVNPDLTFSVINGDGYLVIAIFMGIITIVNALFGAGYFVITQYIFKRKLNLE